MNQLRAVLVGIGTRGQVWRDAVHAHPEWELSAIVDVDEQIALRNAARVGIGPERCFRSLAEALIHAPSDAAIIATPHEEHVALSLAAIDKGIGVLIEKPFAPTVREAIQVVNCAEAAGVPVVIGQNYRYLRWTRAVRALIERGAIGRVRLMSMQYYRPWGDLEPALLTTENPVLWGITPHHLDLVRLLGGSPVASVTARLTTTANGARPHGASLHALIALAAGTTVTYFATYESVGQNRFEGGREFYLRIVGDEATIHVFNRWVFLTTPGRMPRLVRRGPRLETEEATLLTQLRDALRLGREADCSGRENLTTVAALEACLRSHESGTAVDPRELIQEARVG